MTDQSEGIKVQSLSVTYRTKKTERRALDDVSFEAQGTFVAMLGPNGAGKSTLMGTISGMIRPDAGKVIAPKTRDALGIVFQTPALDELLTVRENIILAGAMHGLSKSQSLTKLDTLAQALSIDDRINDQVRHLSGGLKRRVDLARALISEPTVLLLDEPTTGLDIEARRIFWDMLNTARNQHQMTILLATHLTEEAKLADRVLLMREGKIIADDSPATLKAQLGLRVLRVSTTTPDQHAQSIEWATDANHDFRTSGSSLTIANADHAILSSCPVTDAALTLAPPTLADVYTWHTGGGALVSNLEGTP